MIDLYTRDEIRRLVAPSPHRISRVVVPTYLKNFPAGEGAGTTEAPVTPRGRGGQKVRAITTNNRPAQSRSRRRENRGWQNDPRQTPEARQHPRP